ncbi:MAG: hypothetical protein ABSF90_19015 [Syntrophobacteraceae bacterium]|jgi:hypothetical protein
MSNRPKIKKMQKLLSEDEKLRKSIEQMQKFLNDRLDQCSPGAYFKANLEKEGEFFVHTPSRKLDLKSINTLGMLMDSLTVVGEQALIKAVERANKLQVLVNKTQDEIPDEQKMTPEEFAVALEAGLIMDLRMFLTVLMDLPDPEGQVIGNVTAMMLLDYLKPFNSNVSASGEHMKLNMPGESYPIGSPTVFCYVLKYIALKDAEDVKKALAITNFIETLSLFPEFKGGGIPISEN